MDGPPFYNLESKNHEGMIKKKVKKFRKVEFLTDLYLMCKDGTVSMHKMLLLQKLPHFSKYLCEICDHHSATVIIMPDVTKSDLEKEVRNLYSFGVVSGLEVLFGFKKYDSHVAEQNALAASNIEIAYNPFENSSDEGSDNAENNTLDDQSDIFIKQEINPDEFLDQSESEIFGDGPNVKVDVIVKDELQDHSFEIIRSKRGNTSSPGILFVDNQYKFFCQTAENGKGDVMKYSYHCASRRYTKCPARAIIQRDETGQLVVVKCATNEAHNHEASKVNLIVKRMQQDMIEMINVNQSLTARECLTASQAKFSLETEPQLWEEVLAHWAKPMKMRSLQTTLQRAKKSAMGLTGSLLSHMREVGPVKADETTMMVGRVVVNVDQS